MALDVQKLPIEVQFAQGLAGNTQKNRDKTLVLLKKFIRLRLPKLKEQLKEDEFIKLWKGMHYQLWMQDKPLIQEKLVDDLCQLVHDFPNETYTLMFIKAFFQTEAREWFGLDQWRMNKFMMLVREFLHNSLLFLKNYGWKKNMCQKFGDILEQNVMSCSNVNLPIGLKLHMIDIYPDELRKVADDKLSSDTAVILLSPFLNILPTVKNENVMKKLLTMLFVAGGGREIPKEKISKDSEDEDEEEEDSDGCVVPELEPEPEPLHVSGKKLEFNQEVLLNKMMEKGADKKCNSKRRFRIYKLIKRIRSLETQPQQPIKIVKEKDFDMNVEVPEETISAAAKAIIKHKEELLEKVPLRKEYKLELQMEKKAKKSLTETEIDDGAQEEEEEDDGIDMEGFDDDDDDNDSLEFDAEAEFFQMSTESDGENDDAEMSEDLGKANDEDESLPNGGCVENESEAVNEILGSPEVTEPETSVATTKKDKKSKKAGSKRKNEDGVDPKSSVEAPEKKPKKDKKVEEVEKKINIVPTVNEANVEKIDAVVSEKKKKKKTKKPKSAETSVGANVKETKPFFGMVDFPEEEETSATEDMDVTEVMSEMPKSAEEKVELEEKPTTGKKAKKVKQTKKNKKDKVTKEAPKTKQNAESGLHFPLPADVDQSFFDNKPQLKLRLTQCLEKIEPLEINQQDVDNSRLDSTEKENESLSIVEEKDSSVNKVEGVTDLEIDGEVPVTKEKTKKEKGKKKVSLLVKSKKSRKGKKAPLVVEETAAKVDLETDCADEFDKLFEQTPAFFREALAKSKKAKKSKKQKSEKSASSKKKASTSTSPGEKRVSFDMNRNIAKAFCRGSRLSADENAFEPSRKPETGILKPSPSPIRISKKFSMDKKLALLSKSTYMAHFF